MEHVLPERQLKELQKAILDFMHTQGYAESLEVFARESGNDGFVADSKDRHHNLLAKKWTSVIRLQKKIMELETKLSKLQDDVRTGAVATRRGKPAEWLPRPPAQQTLAQHRAPITSVRFHPQYMVLATASEDMTVKIWDSESGDFERTLKGHTKSVQDMAFDAKGSVLVTCSADLTLRVWDVSDEYKCVRTLHGHDHCVSAVCFIGADKIASASRDKTVKIWELATGYCVKTLSGHSDWVRGLGVSTDSRMLCTASNDQSVRLWDLASGECKGDLRGHDNVVEVAKFAPVASHAFLRRLAGLPPVAVAKQNGSDGTSPDEPATSQFIISGSRDKTLRLWDCASLQLLHTFVGHDDWVRDFVVHPSGKTLLSVSDDKTMRVWDLITGRCAKTIEASEHFTTCIDFSSVNPLVATGSVDTTVQLWACR
ncbi:Lissencephaly-1 [Coemansia sp. RSA 2523]|nr:Lissencephaly-1 [Coemansia sp. RSA 1752]KAJ1774824.1 Lissencephaly-1 [Coemansia sp. RSA 1824]KAJ1786244.1 Lissencephaly-1 [Coemansia sp. RSA 1938]KAJ1789737.1 Lissencephaly-1 [Coemansia sp. RSA 2167]KAJ1805256.1 Lissencephaly-1 [Coemansia sp. RSA 2523]KAJ2141846.1 Lissencephaly-1 [Coemansia sp. RSA 564]KAJ2154126.1 Lissencephaly-1 [Coemansia sp. RSA 637]KAJ2166475.1 Lissencephaly-1 [Coemansia sp. RSA 562]KAJ2230430.1 Lissencephaly-1 [Coemansia sp. RSA 518]KAJ2250697.1 Lissencephaly-1 [C